MRSAGASDDRPTVTRSDLFEGIFHRIDVPQHGIMGEHGIAVDDCRYHLVMLRMGEPRAARCAELCAPKRLQSTTQATGEFQEHAVMRT